MEQYPLRFKEIIRDYSFGNRWVPDQFGSKDLPKDHRIAETWEVCDRPGESSIVLNGHYKGWNIHELIEKFPGEFLGEEIADRFKNRFPLLIKFLDVTNPLGEQTHHSDELAQKYHLADPGKTEAWYMLNTQPGATIRCGQRDDLVNQATLRRSLQDGTIKDEMRSYPVQPGDSFLLYAGTMHYSAGGILFYEIMQNSDVYIGLRKPSTITTPEQTHEWVDRTLEGIHIEAGFNCKTEPIAINYDGNIRTFTLACQHFALERLDLNDAYQMEISGRCFHVLSIIEGSCMIQTNNGFKDILFPGQTTLLPANLKEIIIQPQKNCSIFNAYVPDLEQDIIIPLTQSGFPPSKISRLGGNSRLNPLMSLV